MNQSPMRPRRNRRRLVVLVAGILLSGSLSVAIPRPVAGFPGADGSIVWQRNDENGSEIWRMREDGTSRTQLTSGGQNSHPSWSADGSRIVFASQRDGNSEIYVMDADGSNETRLTDSVSDTDIAPVFSPDGMRIAFASYDGLLNNYEILVMDADGSNITNITNNLAEDIDPSWSPDGTMIAFQTNRDGQGEIYLMTPTGSGLVNLTPGSLQGGDPAWAPDGARLAFTGSDDSPASAGIYVANELDGTGQHLISNAGSMPSWSPEGDRIVFASGRDFNDELYVMNDDGSGQERLTNDDGANASYPEDWFPDWQPAAYRLTRTAVTFGETKLGTASTAQAVTIHVGDESLHVTSVALDGTHADDFEVTGDTCTGDVPAFGGCTVSVRFAPNALGLRTAALVITGDAPLGVHSLDLSGRAMNFAWQAIRNAGPANTWNEGGALARTTTSTATYLHATFATDRINGTWARDSGPYAGAYYMRSSNGGSAWGTPKRLNPTDQHGSRVSLAASGATVYAAWVSTTKWVAFNPSAPRVLYFRRNTNNGAGSAWGPRIRLSSATGRVDYPVIAASGRYVYVTYTNANSGAVRVAISADRGKTWRTMTVGSTTLSNRAGSFALPTVATSSSGKYVGVTWVANGAGSLKARTSSTSGATWDAGSTIGTTTQAPSSAASGARVGFAWVDGRVRVKVWNAGSWSSTRQLPLTDGLVGETQVTPAIALLGTSDLAVAYGACSFDCNGLNDEAPQRVDLVWRASTDDGATWQLSSLVALSSSSSQRRGNASPSIVWPAVAKPTVIWNGWTDASTNYRLYLRAGT
jgi:Tol biopolymer transport system component